MGPRQSQLMTGLAIGGHVYGLTTAQVCLTAEGRNPTKKIVGATGTAAAASSGNQVGPPAGSVLEFSLARTLAVTVLVPAGTTVA